VNQKKSVRLQISAPVIAIIASLILVMSVTIAIITGSRTNTLVNQLIDAQVNDYAAQLITKNEHSYVTVQLLHEQVNSILKKDDRSREQVVDLLRAALASNMSAGGYWVGFEPNAFDTDAEHIGETDTSDETGRFMPCFGIDGNGGIVLAPLVGLNDEATDFYWGAKNTGLPYITEPYSYDYGSGTETQLYSIAMPIFEGGGSTGKIIGVIGADILMTDMEELMSGAKIMENGYVFLISAGGMIVTYPDPETVFQPAVELPFLAGQNEHITAAAQNGAEWYGNADGKFIYLRPVKTGDAPTNWVMAGVLEETEANSSTVTTVSIVIAFGVAIIALTILTIYFIVSKTLKPLSELAVAADRLAIGEIDAVKITAHSADTKSEIQVLENAFSHMTDSIRTQSRVLADIAEGDYSGRIEERSSGDTMNISINHMITSMNTMFHSVQSSAKDVHESADMIADIAHQLSQATTEQAATVEEISASVDEITVRTRESNEKADYTAKLTYEIKDSVSRGETQMKAMTEAMESINEASHSISSVIKSIDDIAFQTNILALNASVEAARAGAAGKGFAVVADEVRNLASKSADAAKETSALIENSIRRAEHGGTIVVETAKSLAEIKEGIGKAAVEVADIAQSAHEQASSIDHINRAVSEVSKVVQNTSASAQESAASSEELNNQSTILQEHVSKFKLRTEK
jgi:methyl-accepting chemotaxis protein